MVVTMYFGNNGSLVVYGKFMNLLLANMAQKRYDVIGFDKSGDDTKHVTNLDDKWGSKKDDCEMRIKKLNEEGHTLFKPSPSFTESKDDESVCSSADGGSEYHSPNKKQNKKWTSIVTTLHCVF